MSKVELGDRDTAAIRDINTGERAGFDTRQHLAHAMEQARERNLQDLLVVDVDAHHYEMEAWDEIIEYIEDPVIRHHARAGRKGSDPARTLLFSPPKRQSVSGRIIRYQKRNREQVEEDVPRDVALVRRQMQAIGIDYQIVFPTPMLELGMHPDPQVETAVSWAYTRWFTERILPHEPHIKTMVYLPMNEPDAALRAIDAFSDRPGVVGFMCTSGRHRPMHANVYMPIYRALEERAMPLGFHAIHNQKERMFEGMNRFLSVHALGFIFSNMVHMTNLVINGIPERFPELKIVWIESGLAWVPFLMQRLDNEYLMRTSEAPLLKKKPSDYMREFFYSTQPMENQDLQALELTLRMINAESQLMFASDYPHWDFNLPSTVYDLPFLSFEAKKAILGENARRVFALGDPQPSGSLG